MVLRSALMPGSNPASKTGRVLSLSLCTNNTPNTSPTQGKYSHNPRSEAYYTHIRAENDKKFFRRPVLASRLPVPNRRQKGEEGNWNKTGLRYVPRKSLWNKMERSGTSILFQTNTRFPVFSKNAHEAKNVLSHVYIEVFIIPGYSLEHFQKNSLFRKTKTYYIYLKTLIYKYIFLFRHSRRLHIPIYVPYKLGIPNLYDVKKTTNEIF